MQNIKAEVHLATRDLAADIPFFTKRLGMRMERIYPADAPEVAVFSGHGLRVRLEAGAGAPGRIFLLADDPMLIAGGAEALTSPGGTEVTIAPLDPPVVQPPTEHAFVVRRLADQAPWVVGRAGMQYRDLIPGRLGGAMIASHIRIPDGGPVPDMVHYHKVGFQLIFCTRGWVDVLYEDQGGTRRLTAGDCFIQPPEIRHRVMEASDGIEVIEIGVPAEHVTVIEHEIELPTPVEKPDREWDGQRFVHSLAKDGIWEGFRLPGYIARDTGIAAGTKGVAGVQVVRRGEGEPVWASHDADILFGFVMGGGMLLEGEGREPQRLEAGDAYVIPPGMATRWAEPTEDVEILEVALPGAFETTL
ncbi:cupin domain-containing protein [Pseudoroseicyclus sp. CXY001]|uniref:cupin domain-containing protein n=1 Tax=Pseudoroseicyclus sp. CXY001 TaxID=3242492 RepID=UPI003570C46C